MPLSDRRGVYLQGGLCSAVIESRLGRITEIPPVVTMEVSDLKGPSSKTCFGFWGNLCFGAALGAYHWV